MSTTRLLSFGCDSIVDDVAGCAWVLYERLRFYTRSRVSNVRVRRQVEELRGNQFAQRRLLVAYGAQTKIAAILGVSHRTIGRACRVLEAVGWIHPIKLGNNHRAYLLGWREGKQDRFYADVWLDKTIAELPDDLRHGWTKEEITARRNLIVEAVQRVVDGDDDMIANLMRRDVRSRPHLRQNSLAS